MIEFRKNNDFSFTIEKDDEPIGYLYKSITEGWILDEFYATCTQLKARELHEIADKLEKLNMEKK